jgi:thiol:disulfide interchange protein
MNIRRYKTRLILLGILAVLVFCEYGRLRVAPERVPWQTNLAGASAEAGKTGKRVFIDFTADWCGPCQSLKTTLWNDPDVAAAIQARFVPVRIDVDLQKDIASQYIHEAIPAFVILTPDGTQQKFSEGAMSKAEFLEWLNSEPHHRPSLSAAN